jgi:glucose-6-phosphate-specific signal transduction histidine kinase
VTADVWRFQARHWGLLLVAVGASVAFGSPPASSVLLGGAAIGLATLMYATAFRAALQRGRLRLALVLLFVKVAALFGLGWVVLTSRTWRPDPTGFALGVSCLPVAAVWEAIRARNG